MPAAIRHRNQLGDGIPRLRYPKIVRSNKEGLFGLFASAVTIEGSRAPAASSTRESGHAEVSRDTEQGIAQDVFALATICLNQSIIA
jgi:hypothetical protein